MTPPQQVTIDISKEKKGRKGKGKKDKLIGSQLCGRDAEKCMGIKESCGA
jgi:hypothetical protein